MAGNYIAILRDEPTYGRRDPVCHICNEVVKVGEVGWYHIITQEFCHQTCFEPEENQIIKDY